MITSPKNPAIQQIRRLQRRSKARRDAGQYVVEGRRLLNEVLNAGLAPATVLATPAGQEADPGLLAGLEELGAELHLVNEAAMQAASDTGSPQGLLAVLRLEPLPLPAHPDHYLVLDGVRDPGNMGALIRTAAAAGLDGVLVGPESADPYAPKVLRAGMGGHFRTPVVKLGWSEILAQTSRLRLFLADSAGGVLFSQADLGPPGAIIVSGEAHGASPEARALKPTRIRIPMPGGMESLNAAVAGSILIYEMVRQSHKEEKK